MPPKRRRRFQGLYYHSSPPKVMPMNGKEVTQNGRRNRGVDDSSVKLSTIRIWMHEKDIGKLTRILWAGQGHRLCQQASNNGRVKRFLVAVPHVMNAIKDVHQAVIDNNLETLQAKLEPPVPAALATCRDANGLNIIHKAAGLGHTKILEYIIGIWPDGAHDADITGKTPLHWAASAKNNMRCYTLLTQAGCDEEALDYKMKTPSYYRHKPHEIERAFLVYVPEAPRVTADSVTDWEALSSDDAIAEGKKFDIKIPEMNGLNGGRSIDGSLENTSEVDATDGVSANEAEDIAKDEATEKDSEATNTMPAKMAGESEDNAEQAANELDADSNEKNTSPLKDAVDAYASEEANKQAEEIDNDDQTAETLDMENGTETNGYEFVDENDKKAENVNENHLENAEAQKELIDDEQINEKEDKENEHEGNEANDKTDGAAAADESMRDENKPNPGVNGKDQVSAETAEQQAAASNESDTIENETEKDVEAIEASEMIVNTGTNDADVDDDDENDDDEDVVASAQTGAEAGDGAGAKEKLSEDHSNDGAESPPTSSLAIEGFVQGESEDNTVQSQTAAYVDEDTRIQQIIESGDMEQLAEIVLNGDGTKLLNLKSKDPEIQAFLDNVPVYMSKIRRVHDAARDGSLLALQQALDRRKFAVAKDEISPHGATPLHVAVLFGNSDIVRYLAARFPESMAVTDNDGRTALHYAATIRDNGHFFNVLVQLGGNPKAVDNFGHTPEFFLNTDRPIDMDILNYKQLLTSFGAEELEHQLLNDQVPDDLHSARRELQDGEVSRTLERCFSIIEESGRAQKRSSAPQAVVKHKWHAPPTLQISVTTYLSRFLKRNTFEKIKRRQTRLDHNLFDVVWPAMRKTTKSRPLEEDINSGIIAPDFDVFVVFQEFLVPLLKDMHCLNIDQDFKPQLRVAYFPMEYGERLNTAAFVYDDESQLVARCVVECSRNLDQLELPLNLTIGQIEHAERLMMSKIFTAAFAEAIGETESGSYYTVTEISEDSGSEVRTMLKNLGLMIALLDLTDVAQAAESTALNGALWPYGRGVYINSENNLALWLNCQEHLRIISTTNSRSPADMGAAYTRVGRAVSYLQTQLHFKESYLLGYLQSRPSYLGTGLKLTTIVKLPNLMKELDNLRHLCTVRGLKLIENQLSTLTVRLVNMQSMGIVEHVLFQDYCTAVTNILSLEKDMNLSNSQHIATMLVRIFRRKKNSIVDRI